MKTDSVLLLDYVEQGSDDAFAELVRRYVNLVYGTALRGIGGDAHRAEEVTQTVFTVLAEKAGSLVRHSVLAGWDWLRSRSELTVRAMLSWRRSK